jgi:hypothetical protein
VSLEDEPIEQVAARLVLMTQNPRGKRLIIQAIRAHLEARAGENAFKLIQDAEHSLQLLSPGPIVQSNPHA